MNGVVETPPLTRGRLGLYGQPLEVTRNTPAYAGKTDQQIVLTNHDGKHPRLRGEDPIPPPSDDEVPETPPLTRGRHAAAIRKGGVGGNTPAYAGKTDRPTPESSGRWKHPRLRGEDFFLCAPFALPLETPRLRGEDRNEIVSMLNAGETPPLTRGRQNFVGADDLADGNTPAYAGKTRTGLNRKQVS